MDVITRNADDFNSIEFIQTLREYYIVAIPRVINSYAYQGIKTPASGHAHSFTTVARATKSIISKLDGVMAKFADAVGGTNFEKLQRVKRVAVDKYTEGSGAVTVDLYRGGFQYNYLDVDLCVTATYLGTGIDQGDVSISVNIVVEDQH